MESGYILYLCAWWGRERARGRWRGGKGEEREGRGRGHLCICGESYVEGREVGRVGGRVEREEKKDKERKVRGRSEEGRE